MQNVFETDWLASRPVFYNEKTGVASYSIHDVIDYADIQLHPEGFNNYLEFGYSVFGQTPIQNVKFLEACSRLTIGNDRKIVIEKLPDPMETWGAQQRTPEEMLALIEQEVRQWEKSISGPITLPLSGGYDSRLLGSMIGDKKRLFTYTYGTSERQETSCETVKAEEVSKRLGAQWSFIPLRHIQDNFKNWNAMFGPSAHAHGMYHFDFFRQVKAKSPANASGFLSGIIGDLWAGHVQFEPINSEKDLVNLARHHGVTANHAASKLTSDRKLRTAYFETYKNVLNDMFHQRILFARMKLILLTYLYQVPESFGFKPWSPFLKPEIAMGMLSLPAKALNHRSWQQAYFASKGLDIEKQSFTCADENTLDLQALQEKRLPLLDEKVLAEVLDATYVRNINLIISHAHNALKSKKRWQKLFKKLKIYGLLRKFGMSELYGKHTPEARAYSAYCIIWPIEQLLKRRT